MAEETKHQIQVTSVSRKTTINSAKQQELWESKKISVPYSNSSTKKERVKEVEKCHLFGEFLNQHTANCN